MEALRETPREELNRRLKLTDRLKDEVHDAIDSWSGRSRSGRPAAFAYTGETFRGFAVRSFDASGLQGAQEQVRILSALYGVLRPLDRIERYRLDFGCSLHVCEARSLYEFWRQRITTHLIEDIRARAVPAVVNLASAEFARAVDMRALGVPVITPDFLQIDGKQRKRVTVFSKQARGSMARWIAVGERRPDELVEFDWDGYRFEPEASSCEAPVFVRDGLDGRQQHT
jgi:cytoplasmic iron level regulating protein YaaA (DUF328/UPF0246 family)